MIVMARMKPVSNHTYVLDNKYFARHIGVRSAEVICIGLSPMPTRVQILHALDQLHDDVLIRQSVLAVGQY